MNRERVAALLAEAVGIIEVGDQRLLASDGPVNGQPPDISLAEWRRLYCCILDAARLVGEPHQCTATTGRRFARHRCPNRATHQSYQKHCNSKPFWLDRCAVHLVGNTQSRTIEPGGAPEAGTT